MSQTPNPLNTRMLARAQVFVAILAVIGVVLFIGIYVLMGNLGVDALPRLLAAMCLPPAVIAVIVGVYLLVRRPNGG